MPDTVLDSGSTESAASSAASPAASSPLSTSDIAASVISDMESGNADESPAATPPASSTEQPKQTAAEVDPDDFDAVPAEITDSLNRKRPNAIPHPRVKQMIEKREKKLIASVAKELGITKAEAELQLEDVLGGVKERGSKLTEFEGRFQQITAVEEVMARDPKRFVEMLVKLNPAYADYLKQEGQAAAVAAAQAPQGGAAGADDPEPEPDYDLGNGQKTYSLDGMRKRDAWKERQIVKRLEGQLGERLKPFEERRRQEEERAAAEQLRNEHMGQLQKRVDRARKWPQFKEHEKDIAALMDAERGKGHFLSFEDAYMQIVIPKLAGDRTAIRQEVLAEINKQPKSSSVTTTATPKQEDNKPKTTADIAREVMASLGS